MTPREINHKLYSLCTAVKTKEKTQKDKKKSIKMRIIGPLSSDKIDWYT